LRLLLFMPGLVIGNASMQVHVNVMQKTLARRIDLLRSE